MKKMTILTAATSALALSAGIASAQEVGDTTSSFYGFVLAGFSDQEVNEDGSTVGSDGGNGPSRFGFLGETVLADGMTGGVQIEYSVDNSSKTGAGAGGQGSSPGLRLANGYLAGEFGEVKAGSQWNPMYTYTTATTDVFLSNAFSQARASDLVFRQDGALFYSTPDFDGLQAAVGGTLQSGDSDPGNQSAGFDTYTVAAKYDFEDFYAAATYFRVDGDGGNGKSFSATAAYDYGAGKIAASINDLENISYTGLTSGSFQETATNGGVAYNAGAEKRKPYEIVGTYTGVPNWTFKVAYADSDRNGGSSSSIAAEAQYNFASNVAVAVGATNPDKNFGGDNDSEDILATALYVAF